MSILPDYFELRHFTGHELDLIPVWTHRDDVRAGHVEGMFILEYNRPDNPDQMLAECIFKAVNQLVPLWQPRLFASDERRKQVLRIVHKLNQHGHVAYRPYQDDDCPTQTEVFIKYTQQPDGCNRLVIITL